MMNPKVPLIVGSNAEEGNLPAFPFSGSPDLTLGQQAYIAALSLLLPPQWNSQVIQWYAPVVARQGYWHALSKILVHFIPHT